MYSVIVCITQWGNLEKKFYDIVDDVRLEAIDTYGKPLTEVVTMFQSQLPRHEKYIALRLVYKGEERLGGEEVVVFETLDSGIRDALDDDFETVSKFVNTEVKALKLH